LSYEEGKMMEDREKGQIAPYRLIFTCSWEDPESDRRALRIRPGDTLMTITSGACNTIGFLLDDPKSILAVDINPSQSHVLELKIAAMKHLTYQAFIHFLGLLPSSDRLEIYSSLRDRLTEKAVDFWDHNLKTLGKGFLMNGRYENFIKMVGRLIGIIVGRKAVDGLFVNKPLAEQKEFFDRMWDNWRTSLLFHLFYNKQTLARMGLKADYFRFDDGAPSFGESFLRKFRGVVANIPTQGNYFLYLYLNGRYRTLKEVPDYLREENFDVIKGRLDRIRIVTSDVKRWLAEQNPESIDGFALSNICELMNQNDTTTTFEEIARTARKGARMSFRNLMIPRTVPLLAHVHEAI
jgi:S-adenosylmethionine-diacylglycerol 3-amino-3-carboxypropyl transferase